MIKNPNMMQCEIDRILKIYPTIDVNMIANVQRCIDIIVNAEMAKLIYKSNSRQSKIDIVKNNLKHVIK